MFDQKWQAVVALEMDSAFMKQFKKEEDAIDYVAGVWVGAVQLRVYH